MTADPFVLLLSRAQFGLTIGFHYIFVPLTLGLIVAVAAMDTLRVVTGRHDWRRAARFWYRFFVVAWLIGMATGYPLRLQLEHQWSGYSAQARDVIHAIMGMEGTIAPAMISLVLVLGTLSHGQPALDRAITRWVLASIMFVQAACIVTLNAWMQHPVGTTTGAAGGGVEIVTLSAVFLSSTAVCKVAHTLSAGLLTGAVFMVSVSSFYLLRKRHLEVARHSLAFALPMALVSLAAVVWSGHTSARDVMAHQPMKFAAIEAHWEQGAGAAPLTLVAWPDAASMSNLYAVTVPRLMSWLATHSDASPLGIKELVAIAATRIEAARSDGDAAAGIGWRQLYARTAATHAGWEQLSEAAQVEATARASVPSVPTLFASFRLMFGAAAVLGLALLASWARRQSLLQGTSPWLLRLLCVCLPLPWIATFAGWTVAEVGRQPWVIYEQMSTAAAATLPSASAAVVELAVFVVAYGALGTLFVHVTLWLLRMGPRRRVVSTRWKRWPRRWLRRHRARSGETVVSVWFDPAAFPRRAAYALAASKRRQAWTMRPGSAGLAR